ncbi:tetratricopeptide repeat protein [Bacillus sp. DJP31]|uniref:tetratricopeptide repeat protein n=1 Tax=Bacillus sp. DJP31 TaxID=3409789 RepID=UPI003BB4CEDE
MSIGEKIRLYRLNKGLTQSELSNGIISVSYLSKIETNQINTNEETLILLFDRLGMPFHSSKVLNYMPMLNEWYHTFAHKQETDAAKETLNILLKNNIDSNGDFNVIILFYLYQYRYYLGIRDLESAEQLILKLNSYYGNDLIKGKHRYFYFKFKGLHNYLKNDLDECYQALKISEEHFTNFVFDKWEEGDLKYLIALVSSRTWRIMLSVSYANEALLVYQALLHVKRCSECLMILGINYRRSMDWIKAEAFYKQALELADNLNSEILKSNILHNLGYVYSSQGNSELAVQYYLKGLNNDKNDILSLYSLSKEYRLMGKTDECLKWTELGMEISEDKNDKAHYFHFKLNKYLLTDDLNLEYSSFLKEDIIPYFEKEKHYEFVSFYCNLLGDFYTNNRKYKDASIYYKKSLNALEKLKNLHSLLNQ